MDPLYLITELLNHSHNPSSFAICFLKVFMIKDIDVFTFIPISYNLYFQS